jgi:hypothetical protein
MSGGSFDYLCYADDLDDLLSKRGELDRMREALEGYGDRGRAATRETYLVEQLLRSWEDMLHVHLARLKPIWKAVEWHHSADWGADHVEIALDHYNGVPVAEVHEFTRHNEPFPGRRFGGWICTGCSWVAYANPGYMDEEKATDMHERAHRRP